MALAGLRIGIVGCGLDATAHVDRLMAIEGVSIVGCADPDLSLARTLAGRIPAPFEPVLAFEDHAELIRQASPEVLTISTPNRSHYRPAMDGLQAGCHLLLLTPPSTNVQETVDIVGLATARDRKVGIDHGFRRMSSLIRAREMLAGGEIGQLRLISSTLALPWPHLDQSERPGILAELGCDWLDALLWTTGLSATTVAAIRTSDDEGRDLVASASIRLGRDVLASISISGVAHDLACEWTFHGERGRLRATDASLTLEKGEGEGRSIPLPEADLDVAGNFVAAIREGSPLHCPASEALDAVRLLEAIARSAAIGQFVGLA